jgi:hypothetical protein
MSNLYSQKKTCPYATFSKIRKKTHPPPFEAEKYQSTFRNLQKYTQDPLFSPNSTKSTFRILHKNTPTPQKSISKVVSVVLQDVSVQIRAVQNKADKVYCNADCRYNIVMLMKYDPKSRYLDCTTVAVGLRSSCYT